MRVFCGVKKYMNPLNDTTMRGLAVTTHVTNSKKKFFIIFYFILLHFIFIALKGVHFNELTFFLRHV